MLSGRDDLVQPPAPGPDDLRPYLDGVHYPIRRGHLVGAAEERGAASHLVVVLQRLGRPKFDACEEVLAAIEIR